MDEPEDPFEALRRGNPVPDAARAEGFFLGHRNHLQQVLVEEERAQPRPARVVVAVVGVTCLFVMAGAALVVSRDSPSSVAVACYMDGSLDSGVVARHHVGDPVEACQGLYLGLDAPEFPVAVPCRLPSGIVGVFPGPVSICGQLGLEVADVNGAPDVVMAELATVLARDVNLSTCLSPTRATSVVAAELHRLGLAGWEVVTDDGAAGRSGCATAAVNEADGKVLIGVVASSMPSAPGLANPATRS